MKAVYTIALKPYEEGYLVRVPDMPSCVTGGKSPDEAVRMARDAISGCVCVYEDEGLPVPAASMPGEVDLEPGEIAALVDIDTVKYRSETDGHTVAGESNIGNT